MHLELNGITIRNFERKDAPALHRIVREKEIARFMKDWSENAPKPEDFYEYIDWMRAKSDTRDIRENMRYAIVLQDSDELIGMVGMGLEDTLEEVEAAYFMCERFQRRGYVQQALEAIVNWCFQVSDLPYLILTIDCANTPSCRLAEKCGFELFEKRTPIGHVQPNMESDSYFYFRRYRK